MILDSKKIEYEVIDISEPGKEPEKEFMQEKSTNKGATISDQEPRHALPPQIFSDNEYCGEWLNNVELHFKNCRRVSLKILQPNDHCKMLFIASIWTGAYDDFDLSNENDTLEQFLKLAPPVEENNGKEVSNDN